MPEIDLARPVTSETLLEVLAHGETFFRLMNEVRTRIFNGAPLACSDKEVVEFLVRAEELLQAAPPRTP